MRWPRWFVIYPRECAMHGCIQVACFGGYLCVFPPIRAFGIWWPCHAYWSPNGTPWHHRMVPLIHSQRPTTCSCGAPDCPIPAESIAEVQAHLTEETLERIAWYCRQASQGPTQVIQVPRDYDPVDWCREALLYSTRGETYGVALGTVDEIMERGACMTAFTGNGSQSKANADFYMLCHTAVPLLVDEVRRCWAAAREAQS